MKGISSLEIMYAISNKRLTRSFSSDEAEATALPMGVLLKISFIVLVGCRSRETAFLWMSDFECLTTLSFSSALPVMLCMHERAGAVVSDGSKAILVQAQKAADAIYLTVASS